MLYSAEITLKKTRVNRILKKKKPNSLRFTLLVLPTETELTSTAKIIGIEKSILEKTAKMHYARILNSKPLTLVFKDNSVTANSLRSAIITMVVKKKEILVLVRNNGNYYKKLFEKLVQQTEEKAPKDVGELIHYFLLDNIEENYDVLKATEDEITRIEEKLTSKKHAPNVRSLLSLKKKLTRLHAEFSSLLKLIRRVRRHEQQLGIAKQSIELLEDIDELLFHQMEIITSQQGRFTDLITLETINTSEANKKAANRLTELSTKMTGYATILLIPALVAAAYGMNFEYIPLKDHPHGFLLVTSSLVFVMIFVFLVLKRKKFL